MFIYEIDGAPVLSKESIAIQATLCGFTLKCVRNIIKTYNLFRSVYSKKTSQVSWIMKGEKSSEGNCNLIKNTLRDILKTSQKHLKKDVFFETPLRRLKYISKKMSFL